MRRPGHFTSFLSSSMLSSFLQRKIISTACMLLHLSLWVKGEGGNATNKSTLRFHRALRSLHHKIWDIILLSRLYNYFKKSRFMAAVAELFLYQKTSNPCCWKSVRKPIWPQIKPKYEHTLIKYHKNGNICSIHWSLDQKNKSKTWLMTKHRRTRCHLLILYCCPLLTSNWH